MRIPPLPGPPHLTTDGMGTRAVGDRLAQVTKPIELTAYDPEWPERYAIEAARIRTALGSAALDIEHVGSTAVPGLPAKDRLDIDLIVCDPSDEDVYVPLLEPAGYFLRSRDPGWYEHRCLWTEDHGVNLHVFGSDCDEYLRHVIFRDWLREHSDDRDLYAEAKRRSAEEHPWDAAGYINGKRTVIIDILRRAGLE